MSSTNPTDLRQWSTTVAGRMAELDHLLSATAPPSRITQHGGSMTDRAVTFGLEHQLELALAEAHRLIDVVRSLSGSDHGPSRWTAPSTEHWAPVPSVPERSISIHAPRIDRVLKRDYNYFDGLNESLHLLAEREKTNLDQEPTISSY